METKVYVDVLLVLNYVINMLLLLCTAKLTGRKPKRRRMVAAALFGSASSLTIFLPFFGFGASIFCKLLFSVLLVLAAFSYIDLRTFGRELFVFFAVSFFFAGVMLAIWMAFAPRGMIYYNGVVYFDISSITLILTTVVAYAALSLFHRFSRRGRLQNDIYRAQVHYGGKTVVVKGLMDTGNGLYEPFSDTPVIVCRLKDMAVLLPPLAVLAVEAGDYMAPEFADCGVKLRLIPYGNVGGGGTIPAFAADSVGLEGPAGSFRVERVYVALSTRDIGDGSFHAILHPDLQRLKV